MLEKHSDSGEFDGAGRSDSCNEEGDDSDDEAASANGSRSSPGDDNGTSGSGIPGVGISPENFDPTVIFCTLDIFRQIDLLDEICCMIRYRACR